MEKILSQLGFDINLLPAPPEGLKTGLSCFFLPVKSDSFDENEPITASSMGKIWSGQGLAPIISNPEASVFDDCSFAWFTGTSETTMHDFVYYMDARNRRKAGYFRFQTGFCGEPRTDETKQAFRVFSELFNKLMLGDEEGEIVFNMNEWILRKKSKSGFVNIPIEHCGYEG